MSTYHAPLPDMQFVLNELAGLSQVASLPGFEDATPDTVTAILDEASKFADWTARVFGESGEERAVGFVERCRRGLCKAF